MLCHLFLFDLYFFSGSSISVLYSVEIVIYFLPVELASIVREGNSTVSLKKVVLEY